MCALTALVAARGIVTNEYRQCCGDDRDGPRHLKACFSSEWERPGDQAPQPAHTTSHRMALMPLLRFDQSRRFVCMFITAAIAQSRIALHKSAGWQPQGTLVWPRRADRACAECLRALTTWPSSDRSIMPLTPIARTDSVISCLKLNTGAAAAATPGTRW